MKNLKRNIAIVCGGDSSEHDVSLRSAQGLYSFFDKERYNVYIVDVKGMDWHVNLHDGTTAPIDRNDFSFMENGRLVVFDYAYITIHGTPGENGIMQGYFELIHLPYSTSGVLVEAMTFDKFVLNNYLRSFGVSVAESLLIRKGYEELVSDDEIEERIGMPCFVKPAADGSSFGVTKVKNKDQLAPAIRKAMMESDDVMVESFLGEPKSPWDAIRPSRSRWCSPSPKWSLTTSSSTTMPSTTVRSTKSRRPVFLRRLPSVPVSSRRTSTTSFIATVSSASTISFRKTRKSRCSKSIPLPA